MQKAKSKTELRATSLACCWIARELVRDAKIVAAREGTTITAVVESLIRGPLAERLATPVPAPAATSA